MKQKETIIFCGGLGNQMIEYSFGLFRSKNSANVQYNSAYLNSIQSHNGYELQYIFNIKASNNKFPVLFSRACSFPQNYKISRSFLDSCFRLFNFKFIRDKDYADFKYSKPEGYRYLIGCWQNYEYFGTVEKEIRKAFTFREELLSPQTVTTASIINKLENPVSIHVRLGDYTSPQYIDIFKDICTIQYYKKAIQYIRDHTKNPSFILFSNEIEKAKDLLKLNDCIAVNHNYGIESWQDKYLMSKCKNHIIANSTFSWWGA